VISDPRDGRHSRRRHDGSVRVFVAAMLAAVLTASALGCSRAAARDGAIVPSASGGVSNLAVPADAFGQEFEAILATIDRYYALKEPKGVSAAELRGRFGQEVERAGTAEAFYATLVRLFAALHNSHSGLVLPGAAFAEAGIGTVLIGDRLVLTGELAGGALLDHGLTRGWEVGAIDGVPFVVWLARRGELVSASTPQYERVAAVRQATRRFWFEPVDRRFTFRSPVGETVTLEVRLDRAPASVAAEPLVTGQARGDVAYVAIDALTGDVVSQFESALARLIDKPALILDLRRNSGGNSGLGLPILAHLINGPTRVEWPSQVLQPAATLRFTGRIAALVGPVTHSAAESLAHNLKDSGRATFIGSPTAGSSGNGPQFFQTAHGIVFRLPTRAGMERSVSGAETEGVGLVPHILKEQTYEDFLAGRDTVLDFAVRFLTGP
jgi:carboxyl-terminal processing protease